MKLIKQIKKEATEHKQDAISLMVSLLALTVSIITFVITK